MIWTLFEICFVDDVTSCFGIYPGFIDFIGVFFLKNSSFTIQDMILKCSGVVDKRLKYCVMVLNQFYFEKYRNLRFYHEYLSSCKYFVNICRTCKVYMYKNFQLTPIKRGWPLIIGTQEGLKSFIHVSLIRNIL